MEFFEFVLIISITVGLPLAILKTVLDFKKSKLEARRELGESAGLTVGELKKVLKDVVQEANAPLLERVEALERERDDLLPSGSRDLLAGGDAFGSDDAPAGSEEEVVKSVGRRVHG